MSEGQRKNRLLWGNCPSCMYERPVRDGVMKYHRYYDVEFEEMFPCLGSGKPPLSRTFHIDYPIYRRKVS